MDGETTRDEAEQGRASLSTGESRGTGGYTRTSTMVPNPMATVTDPFEMKVVYKRHPPFSGKRS